MKNVYRTVKVAFSVVCYSIILHTHTHTCYLWYQRIKSSWHMNWTKKTAISMLPTTEISKKFTGKTILKQKQVLHRQKKK